MEQGLGRRIQELEGELTEARQQQTATAEILRVIRGSPTDIQRAFDTIARSAAHLCGAFDVVVLRVDGDLLRLVAHHGPLPAGDVALHRGTLAGRAVIERRLIQIEDLQAEVHEFLEGSALARQRGVRTVLSVPLLKDDVAIGNIQVRRNEVRPFSDQQIGLLHTFADQAVIAIENTRLFAAEQARTRELQGSLDYQTATSEVLAVISRSPTELEPVLDAIVRTARRICEAERSIIWKLDGDEFCSIAFSGIDQADLERVRKQRMPVGYGSMVGRAVEARRAVHVHDVQANSAFRAIARYQTSGNLRTVLAVPLLRQGEAIGAISLARTVLAPFDERQIALVETFADQAVIAIENARLFEEVQARTRELTESLEYQTATSEVLNVISRSPSELRPVVNAIVQTARRLCLAERAIIWRLREGKFDLLAYTMTDPALVKYLTDNPIPAGRASLSGRAVLEKRAIHVPDISVHPELGSQDQARAEGLRTLLAVPLLREGEPIGALTLSKKEVQPFTDKQIELVTTFADQAVIAIENARLFEEVQARTAELTESLEYQTATSDVLAVISRSKFDLQPVLDAIARVASELCMAEDVVIHLTEEADLRIAAHHGSIPVELNLRRPIGRGWVAGRTVVDRTPIHVPDLASVADEFPLGHQLAQRRGYGTTLGIPLLREDQAIGCLLLRRNVVQPFAEKQIVLLQTFADQAVIAMENARLFEEVQARTRDLTEALEYQTAASDVLNVISRSKFDLQPVLDSIVETAARLCAADMASIRGREGEVYVHLASYGIQPGYADLSVSSGRQSLAGRVLLEGKPVQILDVLDDPEYALLDQQRRGGYRTVLGIPLLREGEQIGVIILMRRTVKRFSEKQIELVESFADQAVIAIENTRLFEEVQARNRDLTALGEVGRAVSSTLDLRVVLKTIVERAVHLSDTDAGSMFYYRAEFDRFELGETTGLDEEIIARFRKLDIPAREGGLGEAIAKRQPLEIPDLSQRPRELLRDAVLQAGFRASLIVPLLGAEGPVGALVLRRRQPGEFSASVVSLMQAFADQSAIALENARLFEEIAQKSRELEIASQHKSQFVANMSHELRTPLAAILGYAELMQEGFYEPLGQKSMDALTRIRSNGKHLLGLINTVLDIAKIESGQFSLNLGEYAIETVVETVRAATELLAETKKLSLWANVAKKLPVGLGDEQRLTQVLLNLVGNAIKFTDTGEVRITATAANSHFTVSVTDTGPGIPQDQLTCVFDQFHQVDNSNTKAKGGTGLGLAIAKQIVEMHGGRIWVESTVGKGATFRMELPVRAETRKAAE